MKKFRILCCLIVLCGCTRLSDLDERFSNNRESVQVEEDNTPKTMRCTGENDDTVVFEAAGDHLEKMTQTFSMSFEDLGINEDLDAQTVQERINESLSGIYEDLDGVEVKGVMSEGRVEITVTIDYTAADHQQLVDAGLLQEGEIESTYISLQETQNTYEGSGYSCMIE